MLSFFTVNIFSLGLRNTSKLGAIPILSAYPMAALRTWVRHPLIAWGTFMEKKISQLGVSPPWKKKKKRRLENSLSSWRLGPWDRIPNLVSREGLVPRAPDQPYPLCTAEPQSVPLLARSPSTNRKYPPLPVDKLEEEINRRMADDNKLFREEFNVSSLLRLVCQQGGRQT